MNVHTYGVVLPPPLPFLSLSLSLLHTHTDFSTSAVTIFKVKCERTAALQGDRKQFGETPENDLCRPAPPPKSPTLYFVLILYWLCRFLPTVQYSTVFKRKENTFRETDAVSHGIYDILKKKSLK